MACASAWQYDALEESAFNVQQIDRSGWRGQLSLEFERRAERTVLALRRHSGPIVVQKALYPEGDAVCHGIVLHPPGGYVGGDRIGLRVRVGDEAHALLTTPGAGKWYRSAGAGAGQTLQFEIGSGAVLEWLPQGNIVFNGAIASAAARIEVAPGGTYLGWDIVCLGRTAAGERFGEGRLLLNTQVQRAGVPLWIERGRIDGGSRLLESPAGLGGEPVHGTLMAVSDKAEASLVTACREVQSASGRAGVTRLPGLLLARYLGPRADDAHDYFARLWQLLRPALVGRQASPPRIWRT
jgi:urease accessory protein